MTLPLPPGFALYRGRWSSESLASVRASIPWTQRDVRVFGRSIPQPRLTAWMGTAAYTYSGARHEPAETPLVIARLQREIEGLLGLQGEPRARFNSVLVNLYRDGRDSVAWHADDEPELGREPVIASLSLGATRAFLVRPLGGSARRIWLEHGDLLVMSGRSQIDYQHSIPKTAREVGARVNLTFRSVG